VLIERSFDWYNFNDIWSGRMAPAIFITDDGGVESQMVHGLWHCPLMLHSKEKSFKKGKVILHWPFATQVKWCLQHE
jgi:hypothetical protein